MQEKTKAFNVLKTLYSFQDTLSKLIEDEQIKALSLDEYYIKLQILLSEDNDSVKAALHDKVTGEKKPVEIENIFKAIDVENRIRELLEKNYQVKEDIIKPLIEEENKLNLLYRNIPNKSELEIKYIAESINRIQADVGKVLLLGGAGIGKTTLMHYLSYKWGKDNLWNDKFDYVFRIKLKELLNENWSREYEAKELRQNKLACFIHYCLNLENIEPHEIINISNKDRVLLLLDGYDEVAFLSQDNRDYRDIMEAVFQYKNVIMSSRPNAITENINNKFERKVENTGWDSERIEKYVYKSFEHDQTLGTQLKSFLDTHSQIEICEVPINTALICLIWSDPKIRDKFRESGNEDFNISRLYSEITYWLNNRYLAKTQHKYQHKYKSKTEANNHLKNIMSFLEQIAYESLSTTGKLVENKRVENNKDTLDIDEVIEQGLLRREGQNYQFIHLTFQEFLAARYLKNQLLDNHTKSKTASFIGEHRNEPKYLMTLKFLAGIANNDDSKELTEIFWEAATCNVNGILELGIEKKIALLMHLLAQSKIKDEFDNRIPHLKQIQNLIDDTVLKDITIWEQQIIDSGYLSEVIVRVVNEKLQSKEATFQELKTSTEIITTLANRNEWGSKTKVYESLINLLKIKNLKLQKVVLQKLVKILDETIDEEILKKSLKKIILSLGGDADKYIHITLAQIITIVPNSGKEILNELQKKSKTIIITSIINIIKTIPTQKSFAFLKNLPANPNYKIKIATTCSLLAIIKEMSTQEAFINLKDLLINPDCEIKYAAVRILPEIIKEIPELASEAITFLKEEIINPKPKYNITPIAIKSITKIVKILPNLILGTFNILKMVIINPHSEYNTKSEAIKSLADIVKVKPNLTQETFNFLKSLIINSNNEYEIEAKIIESIIEMVGVVPSLAQKAFVFLKEIITNSKFSYDVKVVAIENIVEILKIKPNLTQAAFSFLKLVITNFNINYNAKSKAIESITRLAKTKLSLIQETFIFLKEIITNPKTNQSIKSKAIESIAEIIEKKPSLAQETFILIKGIIANSNTNYDIESVTKSMTKIVKLNPIQEAFTFLKVAVMNSKIDAYVKAEAIESMAEVIKTIPSLAQEIITFFKKVIIDSDADYYVKYAAIKSIQKIVIEMPNLLPEIFIFFKSVIINSNTETYVKSDATYTITKILKAEPNLAQEAVDFLKEILINPNGKVSNATAWNLVEIIESIPLNESSYKPISELLKIIVINNIQNFDKELYIETKATLTLHKITNHITQEYEKRKNPKMIKWFNGCFKELPNIAETRVFLKEICKTILKSGVINQLESQFILNCVKNYHFTFTVAVNKDHKKIAGEIIFEDRRYEIFQNDNLEEFATMLLAATDDPLAEQYKTHKPLFQSKGLGLKIAASDIMEVNSITYEKTKLPTEASLLSYVRDIKDNSVILLEKRNVFGTHLIYKFNNNNFENVATIYPPYISNEIRKQIFEELESEKLIPCFIKNKIFNFNRCELVNEKGKSFLQNVKNIIQDEKVELQTSNFKLLNVGTDKRLDTHEEIIDDLGKDLKDGGITNKAEINREVERLKQENPKLYNYCNALFWNTKNILKACGIAETEFFKNNIKKTIGERIILFGIKFFNPVIKDLPFVGAIADFITDTIEDIICVWLEKRQDRKLKNKIISINDILRHKIGMQDVEDYFKKIAITITHARKNEIINPKEISQPNSLVQKFQACVQKAGNMIYDKTRNILLPEIIESCDKDNIAVQLALKDSIAFINYLYTNYDDILNDDFDLYEQCKKIVENGTLDALFTQTNKKF